MVSRRALVAVDKFRGSATADQIVAGLTVALEADGWTVDGVALGDGGEGSLDVIGGANRISTVTGPLGEPVEAAWRLDGTVAAIEMASASGLALLGGADHNDAMAASTVGTGELLGEAVELGAREIVVFLGGSATTDGGLGAIDALANTSRFREIDLVIACDVETRFTDAAVVFGPQKGATPAQIRMLTGRLERLVQVYRERFGIDVGEIPGAGAAGGLAGGLLALGGRIEAGFDHLAERVRLDERLAAADLVVTGEGKLDATSFQGKVVGGVQRWAAHTGTPVVAVAGAIDRDAVDATLASHAIGAASLIETVGEAAAWADPIAGLGPTLVAAMAAGDALR